MLNNNTPSTQQRRTFVRVKALSLRFSDQSYRLIKDEAAAEGISTSSFIREAALIRAWLMHTQRNGHDLQPAADEVRAWLTAQDGRRR